MREHMARIGVDLMQPGMLLRSDVRDITGRLILKAGEVITGRHLFIFRAWGVTEAEIEMSEEQSGQRDLPACDPALMAQTEAELRKIFIHTNQDDPLIQELFSLVVTRRCRILSGAEI